MRKVFYGVILTSILTACNSHSSKPKYDEYGKVWCNEPFLRELPVAFGTVHRNVARAGYMYALAGALVLQQDASENSSHFLPTPERLKKVHQPVRHKSGFEVATFELYSEDMSKIDEVVIAFTGSNDRDDWVMANLLFSEDQYDLARAYTQQIAATPAYQGIPITVTGYSLGGGLAVHVAKSPKTRHLVSNVWALNPSPKTYASGESDRRIWIAAAKGEALAKLRHSYFTFWPGVADIGAPADQTAEDYYLIKSNPIYGHFRWVLARNMLHVADLAMFLDGEKGDTEPLSILRESHFSACDSE